MMQGRSKYKRINITLPEIVYADFLRHCKQEGMNLSGRIAVLIKRDIETLIRGYSAADIVKGSKLPGMVKHKPQKAFPILRGRKTGK